MHLILRVHMLIDYTCTMAVCLPCTVYKLFVPLQIGQGYPHEAPKVKCETKVSQGGVLPEAGFC